MSNFPKKDDARGEFIDFSFRSGPFPLFSEQRYRGNFSGCVFAALDETWIFEGDFIQASNRKAPNLEGTVLIGDWLTFLSRSEMSRVEKSNGFSYLGKFFGPNEDLRGIDITSEVLSKAGILAKTTRNADLSGADLRRASFTGIDLSQANLSGADLRGASLSLSNFENADFQGSKIDSILVESSSSFLFISHREWWEEKGAIYYE